MAEFYDPYMAEIMSDPYPVYARLRREQPVYYVERFNAMFSLRQPTTKMSGSAPGG